MFCLIVYALWQNCSHNVLLARVKESIREELEDLQCLDQRATAAAAAFCNWILRLVSFHALFTATLISSSPLFLYGVLT